VSKRRTAAIATAVTFAAAAKLGRVDRVMTDSKSSQVSSPEDAGNNPKDRIGARKPPLHLIPSAAEITEAVVMGLGAEKYGPFNWRSEKVRASIYIAAARRHLAQWFDGEDEDPESRVSHLAHARASLGILLDAIATGNIIDDRPPAGVAAELIGSLTRVADEPTRH
jgi:hypothetical protein